MTVLLLKRASASRPSGDWNDDDYDVLADGVVVGRILNVHAAPAGTPWKRTLAFGHHEDRTPTHGHEATREAAMTHLRRAGGGNDQEAPRHSVLLRNLSLSKQLESRLGAQMFARRLGKAT
jgi:hypothetical protein